MLHLQPTVNTLTLHLRKQPSPNPVFRRKNRHPLPPPRQTDLTKSPSNSSDRDINRLTTIQPPSSPVNTTTSIVPKKPRFANNGLNLAILLKHHRSHPHPPSGEPPSLSTGNPTVRTSVSISEAPNVPLALFRSQPSTASTLQRRRRFDIFGNDLCILFWVWFVPCCQS
ncbi:unnamed protein product [Lathyrus oleraceus]